MWKKIALVSKPAQVEAGVEAQTYLGQCVRHFLLNQLVLGQRPTELLPVHCVLTGCVEAKLSRPQSAPGDAISVKTKLVRWNGFF